MLQLKRANALSRSQRMAAIARTIIILLNYLVVYHAYGAFEGSVGSKKKIFFSRQKSRRCAPPPPKNVERNILGYVDRLKFCSLFLLIAQFNNNKRPPHNTSTTHNNNQNEPPLPYPRRLCPLIPWACQRRPQRMAPRLPMAPRKVPVIGFGRAMVGSLVGGAK
jgi:hypothetical protein